MIILNTISFIYLFQQQDKQLQNKQCLRHIGMNGGITRYGGNTDSGCLYAVMAGHIAFIKGYWTRL